MPPADSAVSFLKQVAAAEVREFPAVSLGETLRLQTVGIVGVGLRAEEALVHLAAFRSNGDGLAALQAPAPGCGGLPGDSSETMSIEERRANLLGGFRPSRGPHALMPLAGLALQRFGRSVLANR